jgi:hypothetical protein
MATLYKGDMPVHENQPFLDKAKELNEQLRNDLLGKGVNKNTSQK